MIGVAEPRNVSLNEAPRSDSTRYGSTRLRQRAINGTTATTMATHRTLPTVPGKPSTASETTAESSDEAASCTMSTVVEPPYANSSMKAMLATVAARPQTSPRTNKDREEFTACGKSATMQ